MSNTGKVSDKTVDQQFKDSLKIISQIEREQDIESFEAWKKDPRTPDDKSDNKS